MIGDSGDQLLEQIALEEACSILRDLLGGSLGSELQVGGLISCANDLLDALGFGSVAA